MSGTDAAPRLMLAAVLGLAFIMNMIGRGATETFAVFLLPVEREYGASRSAVAGVYSLYIFVLGATSPFSGQLVDRLGIRVCYAAGVLLLGASYVLASHAMSLWQYTLAIGLVSGMGASCMGMVVASSLLSRWFTRRLGAVMSLPYAAFGAGVLVLPPIMQMLTDWYGWRTAYLWLGIGFLAVSPMLLLLPLKRMEAGSADWQAARRQAADAVGSAWTLTRAMRTTAFWGMLAAYFFTSVGSFTVAPHTVAYLVEQGFSPLVSAGAYGSAGALATAGIFTMGILSDRVGRAVAATISYLFTIAGILMLLAVMWWPSLLLVYGFVVCFGGMQGARGPIILALIATLYRGGNVGSIFGAMSIGLGLGGAFGSWMSGLLHDLTGSYLASFTLGIGAACCGIACFWLVSSMRYERLDIGS